MSSKFLKTYGLPAIVFLTGASVLIVEVVAMRILSPYFGNTIFSVSSVLSIVLAALSLGYIIGGRLADKRPELSVFYTILTLGGLGVFVLYLLKMIALPLIGYKLSIVTGPIVCSLLLFFIPAVILGAASPFAVKLQAVLTPERGMGRVAGEIFFWSTFGSITGSLLAGFALIPMMGLNNILLAIGAFLTGMGVILLLTSGAAIKKKHFSLLLAAAFVLASASGKTALSRGPRPVYSKDGIYEHISVGFNLKEEQPRIYLLQDRTISAFFNLNSDDLAAPHASYYYIYKLFNPEIKESLVLGGGGYAVPKDLLRNTAAHVDVAEIEPELYEVAQEFFGLEPEEGRIDNIITDGRRMLHDSKKKYDFIFSDVYNTLYSVPSHFTTVEFFKLAKERLGPNGVFVANIIGSLDTDSPSFILSELKTFRSVFPNSYLFAIDSPNSIEAQNFALVGCNCEKKIDYNSPEVLQSSHPTLRTLEAHEVKRTEAQLAQEIFITDDYAPVDKLISKTLAQAAREEARQKTTAAGTKNK